MQEYKINECKRRVILDFYSHKEYVRSIQTILRKAIKNQPKAKLSHIQNNFGKHKYTLTQSDIQLIKNSTWFLGGGVELSDLSDKHKPTNSKHNRNATRRRETEEESNLVEDQDYFAIKEIPWEIIQHNPIKKITYINSYDIAYLFNAKNCYPIEDDAQKSIISTAYIPILKKNKDKSLTIVPWAKDTLFYKDEEYIFEFITSKFIIKEIQDILSYPHTQKTLDKIIAKLFLQQ